MLIGATYTACRPAPREPLITYFNGDFGLSVRYPSSWTTEQAEQEGVWYRYFLAPPAGPNSKPAVSVTLLVGRLGSTVEESAQVYLAGNTLVSEQEESRHGTRGRSYVFRSADGTTQHSLLLLQEAPPASGTAPSTRVFGLYSQGEAPQFERHVAVLDEMAKSLALERTESYVEQRNDKYGFSIRLPSSWKNARSFSGQGTLLLQFTSPPVAADRNRQTVHASLTLTVEPIGSDGTLDTFYAATRQKIGENFQVLSHSPWKDGYLDVMRTETPVSVSRVKRFYRAGQGRGYSLAFEAREDVYHRVSRWCDIIASTLETGADRKASETAPPSGGSETQGGKP